MLGFCAHLPYQHHETGSRHPAAASSLFICLIDPTQYPLILPKRRDSGHPSTSLQGHKRK